MQASTAILPSAGWAELLAELERGTLMVAGAAGTGKTCLARYLLSQLDRHYSRVALIDGDLDRVSIGVPGCLALALTGPWEAPATQWLVADGAPAARQRSAVLGAARLARKARAAGAEATVLDTPGFHGDPRQLDTLAEQALATGVDRVVIIARSGSDGRPDPWAEELAERLADDRRLHRLIASPAARCPSPAERQERRGSRLRAHFFGASLRRFDPLTLAPEAAEGGNGQGRTGHAGQGHGRNGHATEATHSTLVGSAVGLLDAAGYCLGLGRVQQTGPLGVEVITPVQSENVARLALAGFRVAEDGSLL